MISCSNDYVVYKYKSTQQETWKDTVKADPLEKSQLNPLIPVETAYCPICIAVSQFSSDIRMIGHVEFQGPIRFFFLDINRQRCLAEAFSPHWQHMHTQPN